MKIGVIGGGSWATALVKIFSENNDVINWWIFEESIVNHIKEFHNNPQYLSSVQFPEGKLNVSSNLEKVIIESDVLITVVPSVYLKPVMDSVDKSLYQGKIIFNGTKGIVPDDNLMIIDFLEKNYNIPIENLGMITGPCHAEEVAMERLSYLTVACTDKDKAKLIADNLRGRYIQTTVSNDVYGCAYGSVIKNVFAIASGICHGMGYGDNYQSVLISNAIQEMGRFVDAVHPCKRDINKSAYLGDLLVTAYSQFSRNRYFGNMIGKGYSVKYAMAEMKMVAEGYYAAKCIKEINNKYKVDMPILDAVYHIIYEGISPLIEIRILSEKMG